MPPLLWCSQLRIKTITGKGGNLPRYARNDGCGDPVVLASSRACLQQAREDEGLDHQATLNHSS